MKKLMRERWFDTDLFIVALYVIVAFAATICVLNIIYP